MLISLFSFAQPPPKNDLEDEVELEEVIPDEEIDLEEMADETFEFEEFSEDDEFMFEDFEEGEKELYLGPVKLQKVAGREGLYVFDVGTKERTEIVIVNQQMKVLSTLIYPDGRGEIDILHLEPGEYYLRFNWPAGEVIEKVYRMARKSAN